MQNISVVFAGGHAATTALATLEEIRARALPWEIHFIGAGSAMEGKFVPTLESKIFREGNGKFHGLTSGRIQKRFTFWTIPSILKIPVSFFHAAVLLTAIKPKLILSFGGFVGFPVMVAGRILGIPSILHEQTASAGRANIASARLAKLITLARKSSQKYFPKGKTRVIGNPMLALFTKIRPKRKMSVPPVIYVTAGSRGSTTLNSLIEGILRKLLTNFKVIHQAGPLEKAKFKKIKDNLPVALSDNYRIFGRTRPANVKEIYSASDMVVSRAGANTVSEIMAAKRPALLIPIPWSNFNEQAKNAEFAEKFGIARILKQETLTGGKLFAEIISLQKDWEKIVASVRGKKSPDLDAAKSLVDILEKELRYLR